MSAATNARYGQPAIGIASRAHVRSAAWTAMHVLPGVKPAFATKDAIAHRRDPEVLHT